VGSADVVFALNATTGAELWVGGGPSLGSSPAVANGVVYVGSGLKQLVAFDAATGAALWSYATGGVVESSPAVVNGTVYAGSNDGNVYAFDLSAGLAAPARPGPGSLHPDYRLRPQR
jgi:outer membrane protein assembly factor BamB